MSKRQKLLMSAERAMKRLAKLSKQISNAALADWMIQGDKLGNCDARRSLIRGYVASRRPPIPCPKVR